MEIHAITEKLHLASISKDPRIFKQTNQSVTKAASAIKRIHTNFIIERR